MPSTREIRRRIRSVKSTAQITRAMEMVSAVKMRRAQGSAVSGRPYSERIMALLGGLVGRTDLGELHPLLEQRPVERVAVIVITADRGLTGALNANVIRETGTFLQSARPKPVGVVTVGRRGRDWLSRHGVDILADFSGLPDRPGVMDISPIARLMTDGYTAGQFDQVDIIYSRFQSTTVQRPQVLQLLPIEPPSTFGRHYADFIFEPNPAEVLGLLLPRFVEVEIYHALLEARASEHSARMVAMHNATQNANEVAQELTLRYNQARQAGITTEILEIASGAGCFGGPRHAASGTGVIPAPRRGRAVRPLTMTSVPTAPLWPRLRQGDCGDGCRVLRHEHGGRPPWRHRDDRADHRAGRGRRVPAESAAESP